MSRTWFMASTPDILAVENKYLHPLCLRLSGGRLRKLSQSYLLPSCNRKTRTRFFPLKQSLCGLLQHALLVHQHLLSPPPVFLP